MDYIKSSFLKQNSFVYKSKLVRCYTLNDHFIFKQCVFCGQQILESHRRLRTPFTLFGLSSLECNEPVTRSFTRGSAYPFLLLLDTSFLFHATVRIYWISSNGTEPTHQLPNVVLILTMHSHPLNAMFQCICNVMHHYMSMSCHICNESHMDNINHTLCHVSWTIILHEYNFQNKHSFQCQYISILISKFIKQQLSNMLSPIK